MSKTKIVEAKYNKNRIAVFTKNWMEATIMAHGLPNRTLKSWKAWQMVIKDEDIERLKASGAPIKVYVEDVNGCAER